MFAAFRPRTIWLVAVTAPLLAIGCGTTKSHSGTDQLLLSNAIDRSIERIDFRDLEGEKVYFDTKFINPVKGAEFANSDYIISSLRQQMFAAGCRLQDKAESADFIVEARVGALGNDSHEVVYGIPANNGLHSAAALMPQAPPVPTIPEISLAKRNDNVGVTKIAAFAYHRETRVPVWQSGISQARGRAKDTYLFGAGPFQSGTIYDSTQFAGGKIKVPFVGSSRRNPEETVIPYEEEVHFADASSITSPRKINVVNHEVKLLPQKAASNVPPDDKPDAPEPAP